MEEFNYYSKVFGPKKVLVLEGWLARWALHTKSMRRFVDSPVYYNNRNYKLLFITYFRLIIIF